MIQVTRLNGSEFYINPEQVLIMEENPDTVVTLITGEKYIIKESTETFRKRFIEYRAKVRAFVIE